MGEHQVSHVEEQQLRSFMRSLLADVHALERMLELGMFEKGVRRIGAEQEMFLIDSAGRPVPLALQILDKLGGPSAAFTLELAQFNLETNLAPRLLGGTCLSEMEEELRTNLERALEAARSFGANILITGILPSLRLEDLSLDSMCPIPRYRALNDAITRLRGGRFRAQIRGADEIDITHDNVMLEACNTSFQLHLQVAPEEFARLYNLAQVVTAPVLAAAVNSPLLVGRRLWQETRVALFQQSVDARSETHALRGLRPRVSFGDRWVDRSVIEIFRDDVARFRLVLTTEVDEDPLAAVRAGKPPKLMALRLHNGTVYRWNRPCYGVKDGVAHLRIEARAFPAGPTVVDEIANAALYYGLMTALAEDYADIRAVMGFDDAKNNFVQAARLGLQSQFTWLKGREYTAKQLLTQELLPIARRGLQHAKVASADIDKYLGIVEERVSSGQTGSTWMVKSFISMGTQGTLDHRMRTLTLATLRRQRSSEPVHKWEPATMAEADSWRFSFQRIGQFMTTDLFTVRPGDVIDLAANLMSWQHLRHVPVEDDAGRLVGLVSARALVRIIAEGLYDRGGDPVPIARIMKTNLVTVTPDTPTLEAIEKMKTHRVGCLPVVQGDRLVGLITERDLVNVAAQLLEQQLREPTPA
jgi:CBS domain-containing protein/gamma-glutamyl:cysteine ligase YbdK (ATP-grasp superfamily)